MILGRDLVKSCDIIYGMYINKKREEGVGSVFCKEEKEDGG